MPVRISVATNIKAMQKSLDALARTQLPFATAQAINAIARRAAEAERANLKAQLDRPTPFTLAGVTVAAATKQNPTAIISLRDIQAGYLAPEILGGKQVLGHKPRAMLRPVNVPLNSYGNLPKAMLAQLKGRQDIFVGVVDFPNGQKIGGVWQMPPALTSTMRNSRGRRPSRSTLPGGHRKGWKLLIRFAAPVNVKTRVAWGEPTRKTVAGSFTAELTAQLSKALATARAR